MWRESAMRRFVATRNADRCEHISPVIYTSIAATEKITAARPQEARCTAREKSGAVSSTSRKMRQMYQSGTSASTALAAARTCDSAVSGRRGPAYARRRDRSDGFFSFFFGVSFKEQPLLLFVFFYDSAGAAPGISVSLVLANFHAKEKTHAPMSFFQPAM